MDPDFRQDDVGSNAICDCLAPLGEDFGTAQLPKYSAELVCILDSAASAIRWSVTNDAAGLRRSPQIQGFPAFAFALGCLLDSGTILDEWLPEL